MTNNAHHIIGLMGQARTGKDTFADRICQKYGFVRVGLADPLKRFCKEVFDFSDAQLYGDERDKPDGRYFRGNIDPSSLGNNYLTPRYALQTLGTEWGRDCYDSIWIDYGIRVAKTLLEGYSRYSPKEGLIITEKDTGICPGVVFSDIRFINEFMAIKQAGGTVIRLYRPNAKPINGVANHASEEEQKKLKDEDFDFIMNNDIEGLEHYHNAIDVMMEKFILTR